MLADRWPVLRALFTQVVLPDVCADDVLRGAAEARVQATAAFTVGVDNPASGPRVTSLDKRERRYLLRRASDLEQAAADLGVASVRELTRAEAAMAGDAGLGEMGNVLTIEDDGSWLAALELALREGLPLWCDDLVLRQLARQAGVTTFGTLALLPLADPDSSRLEQGIATLIQEFVVDLPWDPQTLYDQAAADGWLPAAAATALSRPGAWWPGPQRAGETFAQILKAVNDHAPGQAPAWIQAAAFGYASGVETSDDVPGAVAEVGTVAMLATGVSADAAARVWPAVTAAADRSAAVVARRTHLSGDLEEIDLLAGLHPTQRVDREAIREAMKETLAHRLTEPTFGGLTRDQADQRGADVLRDMTE
jgi:PIN domain associated with the TPR-GreAB-C-PIN system